jgi:hypothetical protein
MNSPMVPTSPPISSLRGSWFSNYGRCGPGRRDGRPRVKTYKVAGLARNVEQWFAGSRPSKTGQLDRQSLCCATRLSTSYPPPDVTNISFVCGANCAELDRLPADADNDLRQISALSHEQRGAAMSAPTQHFLVGRVVPRFGLRVRLTTVD